nr:flavodoxin family protein [Oscillospiraceae bacterium]
MKVLLINGSPHKNGTTYAALSEIAKALKEEGVESEMIQVGHLPMRGCAACYACSKLGKCVFNDEVNEVAKKFEEADGLIVGSPVHYASPSGSLISFLDRLFYSARFDKRCKIGASVVCARRGGCTAAFDVLNKYFTISGMPVVSSNYWNQVHGGSAEDARLDDEGMQCMRSLGKNAAFLIKSISLGKESVGLPEQERKIWTNFIRR